MASSSEFGYNIGEVLTENLDELIFVLNEDFECEFVNEKTHIKKLGYLSLKNKITVILHQDDLQLGYGFLQRLVKNGQAVEHLRVRQKKNYVYYEFKGKTFTNEKQEIKILITSYDISQFKRSEREWVKKEESLKKLSENLQEIRFWKLLQTKDEKISFQKSSEMLDLVIDNIPQIIYWKNKDLVYLGCNQNYALINNLEDSNHVLGKSDEYLLWGKLNLNTIKERENKVMKTNKSEKRLESLVLLDGNTACFEVNRVPLHNDDGDIVGILCTYNNITERVKAEQNTKAFELKYTEILENFREAYFEVDLKGNFTFMNKSFTQMTGYSSDEMIGNNYSLVMNNENKNKVFKIFNTVYAWGLPQEAFQFEVIKKGDKRIIVETSVYLSIDSSGRKTGFYGITRDITQKFKLEQKLKQSEEKYRHLFEKSPYGIWIVDLNGIVIDCNAPKNIILSKSTRNDIIGKNFIEVLGKFDRPEYFIPFFKSKFENFVKGTPMKALEFKMIRTDGIEKWINMRGQKIKLGEDMLIQVLMQDITAKKIADLKLQKSEEELKVLNKELERKVQERTKELRDSEEKFRTIAENSLMGVAIVQDNKVKYVNQQFAILAGYDIGEVKEFGPMDIFQSIYPDDRKLVMEQLRKKQKGLEDYISHYQYRIFNKDGSIKWIDNYSKTINFMGKPADLVSGIDITERKNAEQKLRESEEKFRTITEHSSIGIVIIQDNKVKYVNKAMLVINEFTVDEMMEWGSNELLNNIHPEDRKQALEYLKGRQTGDSALLPYSSYRIITKSGKIKWIDSYSKTITYLGRFADLALVTDVTDQNLAKQELKESGKRFKFLVSSNPAIMYTSKVAGDYGATFISDNVQKKWGYSSEDFINDSEFWLNHIHPDDKKHVLKKLSELFEKESMVYDYRFKFKDGTYHWMRDEVELIKDKERNPIEIIGSVIDITERKIAEQKLKESEEKYRLLFENMNTAFAYHEVIVDENGKPIDYRYIEANSQFEKLTGLKVSDIIGKTVTEILPGIENDPADWIGRYGNVALTGEPLAAENYAEPLDRWYKVSGYSPKKGFFAVTFSDITDRKRNEKKIKESEEKYRHLYENSPFSIVLLNYEGKIIDMNTQTTELFGYEKEDLIDQNYLTLTGIYPSDTKPRLRLIEELLSEGEPSSPIMKPQLIKIFNKEKKPLWVESELSTIKIGGEIVIQAIIQDVTEKKIAEEKLRDSERILREQNIELKELDRLKTDFISIAAHDLKTPLISVGGYIDLILLREKGLNKEVKEDLNRVLNNVQRLEGYINRLLDVMKIDAKKVELVKREENIHDIMNECLTELEFQIGQKDLTVNLNISENLKLGVDHFRMTQVFLNLLSNAVKFTPKDGKIDVSFVEEDQRVIFKIRDNGKGLTPEEIQKIFGKFVTIEQGVDGYSTLDKGSGLGLYIAKGFIEAHGGKIWVESKGRDLGAEFSFTLPKH